MKEIVYDEHFGLEESEFVIISLELFKADSDDVEKEEDVYVLLKLCKMEFIVYYS